jgi:hypothetical protein
VTNKIARTFEEKVNMVLRYNAYSCALWEKERFLPRFAYLPDDELESLLHLGQEIEQYALAEAQSLTLFGNRMPTKEDGERLSMAIAEKYPYLEKKVVFGLTNQAIYNAIV